MKPIMEKGWWSGEISDLMVILIPQALNGFSEPQSSIGSRSFLMTRQKNTLRILRSRSDASDGFAEDVVGILSAHYISETPVDGYQRVRITFTKNSSPYRRVRVWRWCLASSRPLRNYTQAKLLQRCPSEKSTV